MSETGLSRRQQGVVGIVPNWMALVQSKGIIDLGCTGRLYQSSLVKQIHRPNRRDRERENERDMIGIGSCNHGDREVPLLASLRTRKAGCIIQFKSEGLRTTSAGTGEDGCLHSSSESKFSMTLCSVQTLDRLENAHHSSEGDLYLPY